MSRPHEIIRKKVNARAGNQSIERNDAKDSENFCAGNRDVYARALKTTGRRRTANGTPNRF